MHPALQRLRTLLPQDAHILAYLDDIYVVCERAEVVECLRTDKAVLSDTCHIDVNIGKLAAWSKEASPPPAGLDEFGRTSDIWKSDLPPDSCGIKVLGTPLGTPEFIDKFCQEAADEKMQLINLIPKLSSLQSSWLLLYFCVVPRLNHLLRTLPPQSVRLAAVRHNTRAGIVQEVVSDT